VLPVVLFGLNLPNGALANMKDDSAGLNGPATIEDKGFAVELGFKELEAAARTPRSREEHSGKRVRLIGQFVGDDEKRFTLSRFQMKCCSADSIPLNSVIMIDPNVKDKLKPKELRNKWVEVTGQVQFLNRPMQNDPSRLEYLPAVIVYPTAKEPLKELVRVVPAPSNPYLN
jgi:hypothetical protein